VSSESGAPPRRSPTWRWAAEVALAALAIAVIAASVGLVLTFDYGRDQSIYALVAREMLDGGAPYRDAFDFKPPGIFFIYALTRVVSGTDQSGIRVVEAACMILTAFGLVRLARVYFGSRSVGLCAAAIASQIHAQLDFWHTAQPETFGGAMTVWGLVLASRAEDDPLGAKHSLFWSGVLFGASGLMKPPLAGVGALVGVLFAGRELARGWRDRRRPPWRLLVLPPVLVAAGGALPFVLALAYFASKGALGDLHEVLFVFTPHYTKVSWENASVLSMAWYGLEEWLTTYSSTLLFGLGALAIFGAQRKERTLVAVLLGAVAVHITGIVMQGKFFQYHWGATFPLTALLAALGIVKAWRFAAGRGLAAAIALACAFPIIAIAKMPVPSFGNSLYERSKARLDLARFDYPNEEEAWDALASVADVDAGQNRAVARFLAEHTAPGEPVFVWGFECVIYDLAERPIASRFIYNVPQRAAWSREPMQAALMRDLEARPPAAIVVEHHDVFRMVTGNDDDSARSLWAFPALSALIERDFEHAARIGDFDVHLRRRDEAQEPAP
jgi:hypothetical protein